MGCIPVVHTLLYMCTKFSREGRVAGYLGQCPRFDQTFIFIASLICLSGIQSPLHTPSGNLCFVFFLPLSSGLTHLGALVNSSYGGGSSSTSVGPWVVPCCRLGGPQPNVKGGEGESLRDLPPALIVNGSILTRIVRGPVFEFIL